jgi:hypothetical protein
MFDKELISRRTTKMINNSTFFFFLWYCVWNPGPPAGEANNVPLSHVPCLPVRDAVLVPQELTDLQAHRH